MTDRPDDSPPAAHRPPFAVAALTAYGTNLAVAVVSLLNVLVVARSLGPTGRGEVAFLITVVVLTSHLAALGVQDANANLAGSEPQLRRRLATNSILLAAVLGAGAAGVVVAATAALPALGAGVAGTLLAVALAALPLVLLRTYLSFLLQAEYAFRVTNLAWLAGPLTSLTANGVLAALDRLTVGSAIAAWLGGQALATVVILRYVAHHVGFGRPDRHVAARALRFGIKTQPARLMDVGNYRVDQWFVGTLAGPRELGLYSIAVAWAEMLFYLPGVLVMVQRPDLVRASAERAVSIAAKVCRIAFVLALVAAGALIVAAPILCATLFGEDFRGSIDDLRVLALGAFGIVALELLANAFVAQRRPLLEATAIGVGFTTTIALDIVLIPQLGGLGAAIATAVAYTAAGVAAALLFRYGLRGRLSDLVPRPSDVLWFWGKLKSALSDSARASAR